MKHITEKLGDPDLTLCGLRLWVHVPRDDEWLYVTAHCAANGASVIITGEFLNLTDIELFQTQLEALHESLNGEACLSNWDPDLKVSVRAGSLGHMSVLVDMTPDYHQTHHFEFEDDQSSLTSVISDCRKLLKAFRSV